jgi:hypothetical protein
MAHPPLTADDVRERLGFARRRKEELLALNGGDFLGADPQYRQQLVQEFFFHLVGAIEVLAQLVNEARNLGIPIEDASARRVSKDFPQGDALQAALAALYVNTRQPVPSDLYSDDGVMYRIWNYRHQVTHRKRQPFHLNVVIGTAIDFGPGLRGRWREFRYRWREFLHRLREFLHRRSPHPTTPASARSAHLVLDPRQSQGVPSKDSVPDELERMLDLTSTRCESALALI